MAKKNRIENECVFEVRYKANPKLLDHRGRWAETIAQQMELNHWQIAENRVDIYDDDKSNLLFLGFKNCGLLLTNVKDVAAFQDKTRKLLSYVMALQDFGDPVYVDRIGVRSKFCTSFGGTFDQLLDRFSERYVTVTDRARLAIGRDAKLTDIGAPLNFKDDIGSFKTMSGPMLEAQFSEMFAKDGGEFPRVGIYYDIDYSVLPQKECTSLVIIDTISKFFSAAWDRHARVRDLLQKG